MLTKPLNLASAAMPAAKAVAKNGCAACTTAPALGFDFDYAFQPMVDFNARSIYGQEALVRGPNGESSASILSRITQENMYKFDQSCRVKAVQSAAGLDMDSYLSINFLPNAISASSVPAATWASWYWPKA